MKEKPLEIAKKFGFNYVKSFKSKWSFYRLKSLQVSITFAYLTNQAFELFGSLLEGIIWNRLNQNVLIDLK
jgi:hypothetical protein